MLESTVSELSRSGLYIWPISGLTNGFLPRMSVGPLAFHVGNQ